MIGMAGRGSFYHSAVPKAAVDGWSNGVEFVCSLQPLALHAGISKEAARTAMNERTGSVRRSDRIRVLAHDDALLRGG